MHLRPLHDSVCNFLFAPLPPVTLSACDDFYDMLACFRRCCALSALLHKDRAHRYVEDIDLGGFYDSPEASCWGMGKNGFEWGLAPPTGATLAEGAGEDAVIWETGVLGSA